MSFLPEETVLYDNFVNTSKIPPKDALILVKAFLAHNVGGYGLNVYSIVRAYHKKGFIHALKALNKLIIAHYESLEQDS